VDERGDVREQNQQQGKGFAHKGFIIEGLNPAAFVNLAAAALAAICCYSWGRVLAAAYRVSLPRPVLYVAGAGIFSLLILMLGLAGWAHRGAFAALALASVVIGYAVNPPPAPVAPSQRRLWLVLSPFALVYVVHAMAPEISPDGLAYHVSLPQHYLREGRIGFVPYNMYAQLSQGLEMLFTFVLAFGDRSAAALVHLTFLWALAALMWEWRAWLLPVVLVFCAPVVGIDAASAYNDVAVAALLMALYVVLMRWRAQPESALVAVAGLLAGFAYGVKYTAGVAVLFGLVFVAARARRWRPVLVFAGAAAVMIAPWMGKNAVMTGNPVAPFFNAWFPNTVFDVALESAYVQSLRWYPGLGRWADVPWELTGGGFVLGGLLGPAWCVAAALALVAWRGREARWLVGAAVLFGLPWFSNVGTRFLIPALPFLALAAGWVLRRHRAWVWALGAAHFILCWPWVVPLYAHQYAWRIQEFPWAAAWRVEPEADFLARKLREYPMAELLSRTVKPGERVLAQSQFPDALTGAAMVTGPLSRPSVEMLRMLYMTAVPKLRPVDRVRYWFMTRPYRALRWRQVAGPPVSIAEGRLYNLLTPLTPDAAWRFDARPNPWQAAQAFDGSLLTRWMGEWMEVRFPEPRVVNRLDLVYHSVLPDPAYELEGQDAAGVWHRLWNRGDIAPAPESEEDLPRMAARLLRRQGVHYLLLRGRDYHADLGGLTPETNMKEWPVALVGASGDMQLYRIEPEP